MIFRENYTFLTMTWHSDLSDSEILWVNMIHCRKPPKKNVERHETILILDEIKLLIFDVFNLICVVAFLCSASFFCGFIQ